MMDKDIRITKVKCSHGEWTICYEKMSESTGTYDSYGITSRDMPRDELHKRLQVLANHVEEICELPQGAAKHIVPSGVSMKYTDNNCHAVITALRTLRYSKTPMCINTPARPLHAAEGDEDGFCMSDEMIKDIEALEEEAMKYLNGERAQQQLDFGEPQEEEPLKKKYNHGSGKSHGNVYPMAAKSYIVD